jgi:hypothetical protein
MTTAKTSTNGFIAGETYFGVRQSGQLARVRRISASGVFDSQTWAQFPTNELYFPGGLYIDPTGRFGGDLIVVTGYLPQESGGNVWRISGSGQPPHQPTWLADAGTCLEGVLVCPNDTNKYGSQLAGKILAGAGPAWRVFTVSPAGDTNFVNLGMSPHDFHIIPENQDFYYLNLWPNGDMNEEGPTELVKIPREFFANMIGDILVVQCGEFSDPEDGRDGTGHLFVVHWTGSEYLTSRIPPPSQQQRKIEHSVFAPISLPTGQ